MAVRTTDFIDAAVRVPARSTMRDTAAADAAAARARFARDLNAANRAADATKDAARARDSAERVRSDDGVAAARADRAKAAEKAAETKPTTDAAFEGKTADAVKPSAVAAKANAPGPRPDSPASIPDSGTADSKPSADGASDVPADAEVSATKTAPSDEAEIGDKAKIGDGKATEAKAENAPILDAKARDLAPATPTLAIVLAAAAPAARGASAAVPVAGADGTNAVAVDAATAKAGTGPAGIPGRSASIGDIADEDKATGADQAGGPAAKADFLAALTDAAPTAPTTPEAAAKALLAASGPAPAAVAEKTATAAATPPVPLGQVPMTIGLRSLAGSSEFQIRLDPLELGRIDVKLDIDKERGTVTTHLVVERVETLAMLQRDAGSLQQALAQAGLDPSEGGINLSLRSDGGTGGETARRDAQPSRGGALPGTRSEAAVEEAAPLRTLRGLSGLDIRI